MKHLSAILLVLFGASAFAQDSTLTKAFYLKLNCSPELAYRTLRGTDEFSIAYLPSLIEANDITKIRNQHEEPIFAFSTGVMVGYQWKNWISFETGLQFSRMGYAINKEEGFHFEPVDNRISFSFPNGPIQLRFDHIEVPMIFNFHPGYGKTRFLGTVGLGINYLISVSRRKLDNTVVYEPETIDDNEVNRIKSNVHVGAGLLHQFNSRLSMEIVPVFRHAILTTKHQFKPKEWMWNVGLNFGVKYRFVGKREKVSPSPSSQP